MPPPVTGYSYITARMIETLGENADVEAINISPPNRLGPSKHLHKGWQVLRACWRIATNSRRTTVAYFGCEGDWGLIYTAGLVMSARLFGYTIFLHHHSFSYIDRWSALMRLILSAGRKRTRHIFLCATMRDRFELQYGRIDDCRIVSNAAFVDPSSMLKEDAPLPGPLRLGLLSNLGREKGLYIFIDLLRALRQCGVNVRGVLAGPIAKEEDRVNVTAAESELDGALQYIGPVYGEAKDRFYRDLDVFVFPTVYPNEAQPTVLFEALAAGNRIIAYDRGCIRSQVGKVGLAIATTEDFCLRASAYLAEQQQNSISTSSRETIVCEFRELKSTALLSVATLMADSGHSRFSSHLGCCS
ncbi:glycosyltransferase involved in cell wall biosynthesis [Bradyrhizobium sp. USDA 372]